MMKHAHNLLLTGCTWNALPIKCNGNGFGPGIKSSQFLSFFCFTFLWSIKSLLKFCPRDTLALHLSKMKIKTANTNNATTKNWAIFLIFRTCALISNTNYIHCLKNLFRFFPTKIILIRTGLNQIGIWTCPDFQTSSSSKKSKQKTVLLRKKSTFSFISLCASWSHPKVTEGHLIRPKRAKFLRNMHEVL